MSVPEIMAGLGMKKSTWNFNGATFLDFGGLNVLKHFVLGSIDIFNPRLMVGVRLAI